MINWKFRLIANNVILKLKTNVADVLQGNAHVKIWLKVNVCLGVFMDVTLYISRFNYFNQSNLLA